eukprot:Gb_09140 [translate_table: standard]
MGDSLLVVNIIDSIWNPKYERIQDLAKEAKDLLSKFNNWSINQIPRKLNHRVDRQANLGVTLGIRDLRLQQAKMSSAQRHAKLTIVESSCSRAAQAKAELDLAKREGLSFFFLQEKAKDSSFELKIRQFLIQRSP